MTKRFIEPVRMTLSEAEKLASRYNMTIEGNVFVLGNKSDKEKLLNQACYWIANNNLVKARKILQGLGFTNKFARGFINDEQLLQKEKPEHSGFNSYKDKPMPEKFKVKGN